MLTVEILEIFAEAQAMVGPTYDGGMLDPYLVTRDNVRRSREQRARSKLAGGTALDNTRAKTAERTRRYRARKRAMKSQP
jgi:hypothetical protein